MEKTIPAQKFAKALKFMEKYGISGKDIGELLGIARSTVNEKLNYELKGKLTTNGFSAQFTEPQRAKILEFLKGMKADLRGF